MTRRSARARRPALWPEVLFVVWLAWFYDATTNLAPARVAAAVAHGSSILHLERVLHLDPEMAFDHWLALHQSLGLVVSDFYDNAHFVVTFGVIGWLWWAHPGRYRPLRTALVVVNVVALIVFWVYPTAPPRLLPHSGFIDVVGLVGGFGSWHTGTLATAANQLAAMPSLHLGWATWSAWAAWRMLEGRRWAGLVWAYPVATGLAVLATGNHYLADAVAGVALVVVAVPASDYLYARRAARRLRLVGAEERGRPSAAA